MLVARTVRRSAAGEPASQLGDTGYAEGFALVSEVHELQRLAVLHILDEGDDRL